MKRITILCLTAFLCLSTFAGPKYLIETGEEGDATWSVSIAGATKVNLHDADKTLNEWINETFTSSPSGTDIWLASGTYALNGSINTPWSTIHLYGGFAGTETATSQRIKEKNPWEMTNATVLDGGGTYRIYSANSANKWDGITFQNSVSSEAGGVGRIHTGATILNCRFVSNTSSDKGGALYVNCGSENNVSISNCYFEGNTSTGAGNGGGVLYGKSGHVQISNSVIRTNSADLGGALHFEGTSTYEVNACVFDGNNATSNGAAIYSKGTGEGAYTKITNCLFKGNTNKTAIYLLQGAVLNNTFASNPGGALYMGHDTSEGRVENNIIWGSSNAECNISMKTNSNYTLKNNALGKMITPASVVIADNTTLTQGNTSYFRRPSQGDYHLCSGAAELIAGKGRDLSSDGITTDLDGATRSTHDIGCYIYQIGPDGCSNCFYVCGE